MNRIHAYLAIPQRKRTHPVDRGQYTSPTCNRADRQHIRDAGDPSSHTAACPTLTSSRAQRRRSRLPLRDHSESTIALGRPPRTVFGAAGGIELPSVVMYPRLPPCATDPISSRRVDITDNRAHRQHTRDDDDHPSSPHRGLSIYTKLQPCTTTTISPLTPRPFATTRDRPSSSDRRYGQRPHVHRERCSAPRES
jgi:hypothetical protein